MAMPPPSAFLLAVATALAVASDAPPRAIATPAKNFRGWVQRAAAAPVDQRAADEVIALPGWAGALPSKHFSGYLNVANNSRRIHYLLQEAETSPEDKPLVLWLNGGPGSSSFLGAFTELGQLIFNRDSHATNPPTLFRNPFAWTKLANVLYLETPAGVGFSYCVIERAKSDCENTDTSTAELNHEALLGFLDRFPEYKVRPFFLTGESCTLHAHFLDPVHRHVRSV